MFKRFLFVASTVVALTSVQQAKAHFLWIDSMEGEQGRHGELFFSESPADRSYHLPEAIEKAPISLRAKDGSNRPLKAEFVDDGEFIGLRTKAGLKQVNSLSTWCEYGLYHGTKLVYYAKHLPQLKRPGDKRLLNGAPLEIDAMATKDGIDLYVFQQEKPTAGLTVTVMSDEKEPLKSRTDSQGRVALVGGSKGVIGVLVGSTDKNAKGEFNGEAYQGEAIYASLTFRTPQNMRTDGLRLADPQGASATQIPPYPEAIASFGAAVHDGWLYVYGGHTGTTHVHSKDNLSQAFRRVQLTSNRPWEELAMQTPLQGLALVAGSDGLYRVGGLNARNARGEKDDLHSVNSFAKFDPASKKWTSLAPLPEPRSSHDAVVVDNTIYVVGGWTLDGMDEGDWLTTAWKFELDAPQQGWQEIASPGFQRRALTLAHWQGKVVAIGGLTEDREVALEVNLYDPQADSWSKLPEFPGSDTHGFGVSSWTHHGRLYASGSEGVLYKLADDGSSWESVKELKTGRIFHRLLPFDTNRLLIIGGASIQDGHMKSIELVEVD